MTTVFIMSKRDPSFSFFLVQNLAIEVRTCDAKMFVVVLPNSS